MVCSTEYILVLCWYLKKDEDESPERTVVAIAVFFYNGYWHLAMYIGTTYDAHLSNSILQYVTANMIVLSLYLCAVFEPKMCIHFMHPFYVRVFATVYKHK